MNLKISDISLLEVVRTKLSLKLDRILTQQETIEICLKFGLDNLDLLLETIGIYPILTKEKVDAILRARDDLVNALYDLNCSDLSEEDEDVYN